jgi:hypothetical protein
MKKILSLFLLSITLHPLLYCQIEQVTIRWNPQMCQGYCQKILEQQFRKVQGIKNFSVDLKNGQATLTWKENVPFLFTTINSAMHMIGLYTREVRIKIVGHIKHSGDTFYILSDGDNTRFDLVNRVDPHSTGQTAVYNRDARNLSQELRQQLLNAENDKQIATIEGPVLMPDRMIIPTQIVIDQLSFTSTPKLIPAQ